MSDNIQLEIIKFLGIFVTLFFSWLSLRKSGQNQVGIADAKVAAQVAADKAEDMREAVDGRLTAFIEATKIEAERLLRESKQASLEKINALKLQLAEEKTKSPIIESPAMGTPD
jgi:hypothetical protein